MGIILASASPRRRELLALITEDFTIIPAKGEEKADDTLEPQLLVKKLAEQKAVEVSSEHRKDFVIGADTMVFCCGKALGKPRSEAHAREMLTLLSGKKHTVITGVAIAQNGDVVNSFFEETKVEFFTLSENEIDSYIASGEPKDKAGAYGIQGKGALLIKGIEGDYYNVMGLPVGHLYHTLRRMQII